MQVLADPRVLSRSFLLLAQACARECESGAPCSSRSYTTRTAIACSSWCNATAEAAAVPSAHNALATAVAARLLELQGGELKERPGPAVHAPWCCRRRADGHGDGLRTAPAGRRRRPADPRRARVALRHAALPRRVRRQRRRRHAEPVRSRLRARPGRRPHRRRRRHRAHQGHPRALAGRRRDHDHRLRQHQERRRGDAAGRGRLHHQAVPARRAAARDAEGARTPAPDRRDRVSAPAALRPLRVRQHGQPQPGDVGDLRHAGDAGAQ